MFSINGIGTKLYGKRNINIMDGSYTATKWFIVLLFPVIPLRSYRVQRGETQASMMVLVGMPGATTQYQMLPIPMDWKQVAQTYLTVYGLIAIIVVALWYLAG
jgi:hypothetical protein